MATIKKPKLPRKIKKAVFSDRWNYGLTKYRKTNKFQPKEGFVKFINRLKSLKDRVQPQPKQEWSEEDAHLLDNCISLIEDIDCTEEEQNWLKSLRPQNRWKPSDKQMEALENACNEHWEPDGLDPLYTLCQDLKKLKG